MILLKNARIITKNNETEIVDIFMGNGKIEKIYRRKFNRNFDEKIDESEGNSEIKLNSTYDKIGCSLSQEIEWIYDIKGQLTIAGGIDAHVHLRDPGFTEKETIKSGTNAAAAGGYTTIMAMPNVVPCPDRVERIKKYLNDINQSAKVNVLPYSSITKDRAGKEIVAVCDIVGETGVYFFSDDGSPVMKEDVMKKAMLEIKNNQGILVAHTEDLSYIKKGASVHDGEKARINGWIGIPSEAEYKQVERDLKMLEETECKYHVCHISTKETVKLIREYKSKGLDVSGEVTMHHLLLTDNDVSGTNHKMNPPLRSNEDREALIEGLLDGTIDFIAGDHAPHTVKEKMLNMEDAPFGIVALETGIPLFYTYFVKSGKVTLQEFQNLISKNVAHRFGLKNKGEIKEGFDADIVVIADEDMAIDSKKFLSKGRNTPFDGYICKGYPILTFVGGKCVFEEIGGSYEKQKI